MKRLFNFLNKPSTLEIPQDAFSSGQIDSKLWLCREVEKLISRKEEQTIWIFGGWVGVLSFLLLSRENLNIKSIYSFDLDPRCEKKANWLNQTWHNKHKFKAKTLNCNDINHKDFIFIGEKPNLIINTSVEHFLNKQWFLNIHQGAMLAIQTCNLKHPEHFFPCPTLEEFKSQFPLTQLLYSGALDFEYPKNSYSRFMLIGKK